MSFERKVQRANLYGEYKHGRKKGKHSKLSFGDYWRIKRGTAKIDPKDGKVIRLFRKIVHKKPR